MRKFTLIAPCHFGLEAVLKREITDLGYDVEKTEDGRVTFLGDEEAVSRVNIFSRTAERILIRVGAFRAQTFEELFQGTRNLPWEDYIPENGRFWVAKAASVKSKLFSPSDIQSVMKKAIVERLKGVYHTEWFPEDGAPFPLRVFLMKDEVTVGLDTTGESLHKRGYRKLTAKAPIAENLAAALIMLTPWKQDRILVDPFCGSGTIPIEAAMMAANMAPGMHRRFLAQDWPRLISPSCFADSLEEAEDLVDLSVKTDIQGYDIDDAMVAIARENAKLAGVEKLIHFQRRDVAQLSHARKYGFIITNPPYGERLEEKKNLPALYRTLGQRFRELDSWSLYVISAYENAEADIGRKAARNRKIYNGMMKTYYYQFPGPKPPGRKKKKIIFATGNQDKMREIRMILRDMDVEVLSMKEAGIEASIEENGSSFAENALIKARSVAAACGEIVLADDSGLEIDALQGEPGIYSARYMGENTSYHIKNANLIGRLEGVPMEERTARFVCAIAAVFPDGREFTQTGVMEGLIGYEEKGENGFGYDPIFYLPEYGCSSAELEPDAKNAISHRGKALRAMKETLVKNL